MKLRVFLIATLSLFTCACMSQVNLVNCSLTDTTKNILYKGFDNRIHLSGIENSSSLQLSFTEKGNRVVKNYGKYFATIEEGEVDTLKVHESGNLIHAQVFELHTIPNPVVQMGKVSDTLVSIDEILEDPTLRVSFGKCFADIKANVTQFSVRIKRKGSPTLLYDDIRGSKMPNYIINLIQTMKSGDQLIFHEIIGMGDFCPRSFNDVHCSIE